MTATPPGAAAADEARRFARERRPATLACLTRLLAFPTVSADPRRAADLSSCAAWLARLLDRIGLADVAVLPGRAAPVVTAAWHGRPGQPTLLVYGHYDVQPPGPASAWTTAPFRATRAGDYLYARGASDDKGQLMAHLAAIEAWLATAARLPVGLRLVLDGEEEIGSPTLTGAIARGRFRLPADAAVISDTWMRAPGHPVLITSLRGAIRARLSVSGPARDLHAGTFGGAVASPAQALARLLTGLQDETGRISVRGFYDGAGVLTRSERAHLARAGPPDAVFLASAGVRCGHGEPGFTAFERTTRRPAIVVTGLRASGGDRTVVPAWAAADLSVRIVSGQDPRAVVSALRRHVAARTPPGVRAELLVTGRTPPYRLGSGAPVVRAVRAACRNVYGREPVLLPSGGSIPFAAVLAASRGTDVALFGFGLRGDRAHAPGERLFLPNLFQGTDACIELYQQAAAALRQGPASRSPVMAVR